MGLITELAKLTGMSVAITTVTMIALAAILYYAYRKATTEEKRKKIILFSLISLVVMLFVTGTSGVKEEKNTMINDANITIWQEDYTIQASKELKDYSVLIENTEYYDYNNIVISQAADKIMRESSDSEEAIQKALDYVYNNVAYVYGEPDVACYEGTAPKILESGQGQCDTQSIVLISLLRKMKIASKPVGGCVFVNPSCKLQSFIQQSFQGSLRTPKYSEVNMDDNVFSRGEELSRQGGLHAYSIAWVPEKGWVALEATTGLMADTKCYYYHVELFPEDSEKSDICVSKSYDYSNACRFDNLESLNEFGKGLVTEVSP